MEGPREGGVQQVDWCICGPTRRSLKMRSRSEWIFFQQQKILVLLSASVERFGVSRMRDFCSWVVVAYDCNLILLFQSGK